LPGVVRNCHIWVRVPICMQTPPNLKLFLTINF
ncbi:hypothetical protein T03_1619, partial [Trichinella britovi]